MRQTCPTLILSALHLGVLVHVATAVPPLQSLTIYGVTSERDKIRKECLQLFGMSNYCESYCHLFTTVSSLKWATNLG